MPTCKDVIKQLRDEVKDLKKIYAHKCEDYSNLEVINKSQKTLNGELNTKLTKEIEKRIKLEKEVEKQLQQLRDAGVI